MAPHPIQQMREVSVITILCYYIVPDVSTFEKAEGRNGCGPVFLSQSLVLILQLVLQLGGFR